VTGPKASTPQNEATPSPSSSEGGASAPSAPLASRLALVYRGPVVGCDGCSEAIANVLTSSGHGLDVQFVGPNEKLALSAATLKSAAVYAQPGGDGDVGDSEDIVEAQLGGTTVMADWVKAGGRFYGTCMGGYFAAAAQKAYPRVSDRRWPGFGLLEGTVGEWIESEGASITNDKDSIVEVLWKGQPRRIYFQDGPYFLLDASEKAQANILATYASNGQPAVVVAPLGGGKVAVVGPHLEAEQDWYDSEGLTDPDDPDGSKGHAHDLARELVDVLLE
jgi:hypothetical protein